MKHPDYDISVYIHSNVCQYSGHCTCPNEEEVKIKGQAVSCRIRGLIGTSWNYRIFINLTSYEIERLADYERFYTLVVIFNHKKIEQRCIDRRDSSTIFVLRPDKDSNPQYIHQAFLDLEIGSDTGETSPFAGPCNWLIEIKVSYGQIAAGCSSLLRRTSAQDLGRFGSLGYGTVEEVQISEDNETPLVHFKFVGGPLAKLEQLKAPKLRPQEPSMLEIMSIGYPREASSPNELSDDAPIEDIDWDSYSLPHQRTITVQYSDAGLKAASRFVVDPEFVSIFDQQSQDDSLIISTGTIPIYHPQPKWDIRKLEKRWEGQYESPTPHNQDPGRDKRRNERALNIWRDSQSGIEFDLTDCSEQISGDRLRVQECTDPLSIVRRIRNLKARFDRGLSSFKENDRYPWEDRAKN